MKFEDDRSSPRTASVPTASAQRSSALSERVQSLRMPEAHHATRPVIQWFPWTLCAILAGSTAWLGYQVFTGSARSASDRLASPADIAERSTGKTDPQPAPTQAAAQPLPTAASEQRIVLESKGYIIAAHQILVSPKVSGTVTKLYIEEGMRVKKGDVLAEVEDVDYRTDYDRAAATLALSQQQLLELQRGNRPEEISQARAQLQEAEAQLDTLEADWKRIQVLRKSNTVTPQDYDQAQSRFKAMQRQVERLRFALSLMEVGPRQERIEAARAEVRNAQASLEKAKWKLDNCKIRSPVTGTILKKNAEEGNLVNAIAFSGSVSLCELADLSDLEVDLTVQERDIARVFKGQKCKVRAEAFPERLYDGVVSRLMPIADRSKGAIPVRVKLTVPRQEEGIYLKPEMGAIVTFYGDAGSAKSKQPLATAPEPGT